MLFLAAKLETVIQRILFSIGAGITRRSERKNTKLCAIRDAIAKYRIFRENFYHLLLLLLLL